MPKIRWSGLPPALLPERRAHPRGGGPAGEGALRGGERGEGLGPRGAADRRGERREPVLDEGRPEVRVLLNRQ